MNNDLTDEWTTSNIYTDSINNIKYKSEYLQLNRLQRKQHGGIQFFLKMTGKPTVTIDTVEDNVNNTVNLIEKIREKFLLPPPLDFSLTTNPTILSYKPNDKPFNIHKLQTIMINPIIPKIKDPEGVAVLTKLFDYLYREYNNKEEVQIIVVPFSSNIEQSEISIDKNITQQFQYMNIKKNVSTIIYVLFDRFFFMNINNEFYNFIKFKENPVDFPLSETEHKKIKKYTNLPRYDCIIRDELSAQYCEYFNKNVRGLLEGKNIIFYVVNAYIENEEVYKKGCSIISNCELYSFEGADFNQLFQDEGF